jgi:hypothetical protein
MIRRMLLVAGLLVLGLAVPAGAQTYGTPGVTTDVPLAPGAAVTVSACCYVPGTAVTFSLVQANRLFFGPGDRVTAIADANGIASVSTVVRGDAVPGTVTLQVAGEPLPGSGTPAVADTDLDVVPAGPTPSTTVSPTTSTSTTMVVPSTSAAVAAEELTAADAAAARAGLLPVTGPGLARRLSLVAVVLLLGGTAALGVRRRRPDQRAG